MEKQATKKRQIKLNTDEAMLLSERIMKDSFNGSDNSFFVRELSVDDIHVLSMEVLKLSDFINALELLKPAYLKKIRTWLRVQRSRSAPCSGLDRVTTMNVTKRNVYAIDELVMEYNDTHKGANISRDEMLSIMVSNYKFMK